MTTRHFLPIALAAALLAVGCSTSRAANLPDDARFAFAADTGSDDDALKIAALEGLMAASPERALPLASKVLDGQHSIEVKRLALFIVGQTNLPAGRDRLLRMARDNSEPLQADAIRMIGISGHRDTLAELGPLFATGDARVREAVMNAYLIADDREAVFAIARDAQDDATFAAATRVLGAMGATEELRKLSARPGGKQGLAEAYAVAGDVEALTALARDAGSVTEKAAAIRGLGIAGGPEAKAALVESYRVNADQPALRNAALEGLLIADHDAGVLALYRASSNAQEKRQLLRTLVTMDSDLALEVIDSALEGQ